MRVPFVKMSGAGNDFVVIDNRGQLISNGPEFAKSVCHRRWGIGADGLLLLESSKIAAYRMMYYNADGSYGGMCGNGGRCIASFAANSDIAAAEHSFEALDHLYAARVRGENVDLSMKDAHDLQLAIVLPIKTVQATVPATFMNTGSPHVVIATSSLGSLPLLDTLDVEAIGREVRSSERFAPDGTNVNFIELDDLTVVRIRTYERGVEAETLACGTGSIAGAIAAQMLWGIGPPTRILVKSGATLQVNFERVGTEFRKIQLSGPAVKTFAGHIDVE